MKSLLRIAFRRLKISASEVMTKRQIEGDIDRVCGLKYFDHPQVLEYPELHVTCLFDVFKL